MLNSFLTAFAIYFVIWWLVLFVVLPFGVRSQHEDGPLTDGTEPGAPVASRMPMKLLATTIISLIVYGICAYAYSMGWFNVERLAKMMGVPL